MDPQKSFKMGGLFETDIGGGEEEERFEIVLIEQD